MNILQKLKAIVSEAARPSYRSQAEIMREAAHLEIQQERIDARQCNSVETLIRRLRHYDGYVREAALERAAELASPQLLPSIVERLNDWVPQVRRRAQDTMRTLLPSLDGDAILGVLPGVQHLLQSGRTDHAAWVAEFERAAIGRLGLQDICDGLHGPDARIVRACYRLLRTYELIDAETLIRQVLPHNADIVVSRSAVDAIAGLPPADQPDLYRLALASRYGMLRAIALRKLLTEQSDGNDALATRMLFDLQVWVRMIASAYLAKRGIDSAALYAHKLQAAESSIHVLRVCLASLAELGDRRFVDLVRRFTMYSSARVQAGAFLAWMHFEPGRKDEIAHAALASPFRRVRKLGLTFVRKHGAYLPPETALAALKAHGDTDLMLLFARSDSWIWFETIIGLEAASRGDSHLRQMLATEMASWLGSARTNYSKPSAAQRSLFLRTATVEALYALSGEDASRRRQLKFELELLSNTL